MENQAPYYDAHCHISALSVKGEEAKWIRKAKTSGLQGLGMGGTHDLDWARQLELQSRFPGFLRSSFGIHPWWVESFKHEELEAQWRSLERLAPGADGIGETGLDYGKKRDPERFALQEIFFKRHLELARRLRKPLILHVVGAHSKALALIHEVQVQGPILVHSFSGSAEEALLWVKAGAFLSFGGRLVTANPNSKVVKALKVTPVERILFETDAPDQAWTVEGNEPHLVLQVYEAAARILEVPLEGLAEKVAENFKKIR